ncbi:MAG: hypothetical protein O3A00_00380 [Planctomycetota bacterium]|nr:hypothetical protein [Planctomycetota bacterium]
MRCSLFFGLSIASTFLTLTARSTTMADENAFGQFSRTSADAVDPLLADSRDATGRSALFTPFASPTFPLTEALNPISIPVSLEIPVTNHAALAMNDPAVPGPHDTSQFESCTQLFDDACGRPTADHKNTGFMNLNYFWDDRDANWFTVYSLAALPHDFTYFSLLNLVGQFDQPSETENLTSFYTEQNLWHPIAKDSEWLGAFDYSVQWVDASFLDPLLRLGVQWRVKDTAGPIGEFFTTVLGLDYRIYFHAIETDGSGMQIEHFYLRTFQDGLFLYSRLCRPRH